MENIFLFIFSKFCSFSTAFIFLILSLQFFGESMEVYQKLIYEKPKN